MQTLPQTDLNELQREVISHWEKNGEPFVLYEENDALIKDKYYAVLNDPDKCILELGFDSIASYLANKKTIGVQLGYARISKTRTKYFYQKNGKELEFYMDHDPKTGLANIWVRPGMSGAINPFVIELLEDAQNA